MNRFTSVLCFVAAMFLVPFAGLAGERDIPNLIGVWSAAGSVFIQDKTEMEGIQPTPHAVDVNGVLTIHSQEGFRFTGEKVLEGDTDALYGIIRFDNLSALVMNEEGFETWTFSSPDKIEGYAMVEHGDRVQASAIRYLRIPPRTR